MWDSFMIFYFSYLHKKSVQFLYNIQKCIKKMHSMLLLEPRFQVVVKPFKKEKNKKACSSRG